eukprot:TRINITY_DN5944_c0_g1_i1.p1 TRINITY_DN5944_c0_g1~~TRINITY_DN5944_c0_g1_i1.p1  ORF type:complete len:182 (-),score=27.23 TRINITY_DN5944_c0_g1_i1:297-806(-)
METFTEQDIAASVYAAIAEKLPPLGPITSRPLIADVTLEDFLKQQGLDSEIIVGKNQDVEEFNIKFNQIKKVYREASERLSKLAEDLCLRVMGSLLDASQQRPVSAQEMERAVGAVQMRIEASRRELKLEVFEGIAALQRQYNSKRDAANKNRRALDKDVTSVLNTWFF